MESIINIYCIISMIGIKVSIANIDEEFVKYNFNPKAKQSIK